MPFPTKLNRESNKKPKKLKEKKSSKKFASVSSLEKSWQKKLLIQSKMKMMRMSISLYLVVTTMKSSDRARAYRKKKVIR